ncbi:Man1-Src1p-C-terminal domain-containing protein [Chaetomidium leptoderma]|uniref:Man1-Src1p-C-terminal domain-containing protein n=1 Tax=Chaetomidium leptoderma TaxID=669021 RepID=A0AAN6ZYB8_9PEZI|nr:Man1-Src1p-C-terminal domain-containing protein [Chaetomidium leptoderma]
MSDTESADYLQADFDPWSLTVPRLRSILVTHNIHYPSQAKKPQLVELFDEHVVPQSKQILATRARAKRTSRGIVDADSHSTTSTDLNDEPMPPPPSARRSRSPRKTTRVKRESEEPDHAVFTPAPRRESPRKRQSRSTSAQLPPASDTDTGPDLEPPRSVRRDRRVTPAPKLEPPEEEEFFKRTPETETVFSSDNPFQSGVNSPMSPLKTPTNRRKTAGLDLLRKQTPSTARRRTDGYDFDDTEKAPIVSRDFEIPLSRTTRLRTPEMEMEPDEEFTPDEQLALTQEEAAQPALAASRRAPQPSKRSSSLSTPLWVLVTTLFVAYAAWYRQEKMAVGYCGLGREPTQLIPANIQLPEWAVELGSKLDIQNIQNIQVPDWLTGVLEPRCEPCPPHAYCYEGFTARCEPDFILKPHPLSLGGFIPVPPSCEPDGEKVRRVQAVADKAVEELRDRRAKYECGEPLEPEGEPLDSPAVQEQELKEILSKKRSKRMAADEFDELWTAAIGEVKAREEVQVQQDEPEGPQTGGSAAFPATKVSSTSLARLSYTCALRRSVKLGVARYRLSIGGLMLTLLSVLYGRRRFMHNRALAAQIPALVDEVIERLATQKEVAFEGGDEDAFLFVPNLRDDVLRSLHSLSDRERLWQRVRAVVEQNSNVRRGQREGHNGEVGTAWEWIGPSRLGVGVGDGSVARRRKSARVSWGPDVKGEIEDASSSSSSRNPASEALERKAVHRKWEEGGRPIY